MVDRGLTSQPADHASQSELSARLGRNLAARRKSLGLTQAQVAERLGVDTETLSRFERGKHVPSLLTLERLAGVLSATCADLLEEVPKLPTSDALMVSAWLNELPETDRAFVRAMLKSWCDHLGEQRSAREG